MLKILRHRNMRDVLMTVVNPDSNSGEWVVIWTNVWIDRLSMRDTVRVPVDPMNWQEIPAEKYEDFRAFMRANNCPTGLHFDY